ncbi:MAG: RidA family protein [Planctomycetota bacterium]
MIQTAGMPKPGGHYSPCVEHGGLLYVSGQLPMDRESGQVPDGIEAQTKQALSNFENILKEAGSRKDLVISMRVYISNGEHWGKVNQIYAEFFGDHRPARAVIPTRELHYGSLLEIEGIAAVTG